MSNTINHKHLSDADKLARLKRARQIIRDGYPIERAERRTHTNIRFLRQWAADLNFTLEERKQKA